MALSVPGDTQNSTTAGRSEMRKKKKVALQPGKGLRDWVRLSNLQRMTKYAQMQTVDEQELSRHYRQDDCWMLLFDMMRAAGTDGTQLFNEEHKWVNFKSMLSSCVIGPFRGNSAKADAGRF